MKHITFRQQGRWRQFECIKLQKRSGKQNDDKTESLDIVSIFPYCVWNLFGMMATCKYLHTRLCNLYLRFISQIGHKH